jgi:alkanesulfonate monooxygenase SsuD/methylene tetrahydromethanopterin reductase-like flavin-dependent oxidoreductase (luciferase family)
MSPEAPGTRVGVGIALREHDLSGGEDVDFRGRFFELHGAIRPTPTIPIPIRSRSVGGRPNAALARTGRLGEGWLTLWVAPRRFVEATETIEAAAAQAGRSAVRWQHSLQLWASFDASPARSGSGDRCRG